MENEVDSTVTGETADTAVKGETTIETDAHKEASKPIDGYPADTPVSQMTVEQQVAYWRTQSRKHEDREKALNKQLSEANGDDLKAKVADLEQRLAERDVSDAKKDVRLAHPEITDTVFELCEASDPDAIRAWGDKMAQILKDNKETAMTENQKPATRDGVSALALETVRGIQQNASPTPHVKGESRRTAYEKAKNKYTPKPVK